MTLYEESRGMLRELAELRHDLHRHPEIGLNLPRTQRLVLDRLADLPVEVSVGRESSSVIAVLRGGMPGPVVLLRGDMDALPQQELTCEPFASVVDNTMHACGHDMHATMLVGAARLLAARREQLAGSVIFMFQPGEEGFDGASGMLAEGLLDVTGERPVAAYGAHVLAQEPVGSVRSRAGSVLLAGSRIDVTLSGRGGHGASPQLAADPVPALAEILGGLQQVATRAVDPFETCVLTTGRVHAGTASNIIPDKAEIGATLRSSSNANHQEVLRRVRRFCEYVAAAHGVDADVCVDLDYPATVNDAHEVRRAEQLTRELFGANAWQTMQQPMTASDDFGHVLAAVPGVYIMVGARPRDIAESDAAPNHSPYARFDDEALPRGASLLAALALDRLASSDVAHQAASTK